MLMTPGHAGVRLFPLTTVCFRMLQFRMFRMLGVIEHTALYERNPDIRYAYVCAVYIRNRINTDGPALVMTSSMRDVTDTRTHAFDRSLGHSVRLWPVLCTKCPRDNHPTIPT